jgi:branched-chain amino acid transport system permease protein
MDAGTNLLQLVVSGIMVGSIYSLVGMGFVITYRTANVFNIAYGQFAVLGAFIAWSFIGTPQEPQMALEWAIPLTILCVIVFGLLVEWLLFRRMIGKPVFATFILGLGLLMLLRGLVMLIWDGGDLRALWAPSILTGSMKIGNIVISKARFWSFGLALLGTLTFLFFFKKTRLGLAMRAIYDNQIAARCLGVSARLNSQIAWVLCALIASGGGILIAVSGAGVSLEGLESLVMVVLAVVLIGGLDSLLGCVIGGLILAIGKNLAIYYLGGYIDGIETIFSMILIVVVLLIRPHGLLGTKPIERV